MSLLDTLKESLPIGESTTDVTTYECQECGNRFKSAKDPESVRCLDCLATDVEAVDGEM